MDDHLGDIIYFLLIAVFAVIGMLGKKNKKKPTVQKGTGPPVFPNPWSELEKQFEKIDEPVQKEVVPPSRQSPPPTKSYRSEAPRNSSETIYSTEYEKPVYETMSYDTVDDISKLRIKKQMKESVRKNQSSFVTSQNQQTVDEVFRPIDVELESADDAKRAFIYSEIFNRKYS